MSKPLTTKEVAEQLNATPRFVTMEISAGRLPAFKLGRKSYRIYQDDLNAWIAAAIARAKVDAK